LILELESLGKSGAEGELFRVKEHKDIVAKVFNSPEIAKKKESKIKAMIELFKNMRATNPYYFKFFSETITMPRARLYTREKKFCGFLMNRIDVNSCLSLGHFMTDKYREYTRTTDYSLKIVVLERLVEIVEKLNKLNIVVGDLNYDNVFICKCPERNVKIVVIDVDSFQFEWSKRLFRLDGIHPDIIPPEILKRRLPSVRADSFVIGILMFRIIMKGFSPFQYIPDDAKDEMVEERILQGKNVFNTGRPPKGLPSFDFLAGLKQIIERALNPEPFQRPSTTEILTVLREIKKNIRVCHLCGYRTPPLSKCLFCGNSLE